MRERRKLEISAEPQFWYSLHRRQTNACIRMLLLHDIGEIEAGDKIVFAEHGWGEQKAAERRSVERIFGLLPEETGSALLALWQEFDRNQSAESRFAHAIDRAMPVLLNLANDGGSWRENGIRYERVVARIAQEIEAGCPVLWNYLDGQLQEARQAGWFGMKAASPGPSPLLLRCNLSFSLDSHSEPAFGRRDTRSQANSGYGVDS